MKKTRSSRPHWSVLSEEEERDPPTGAPRQLTRTGEDLNQLCVFVFLYQPTGCTTVSTVTSIKTHSQLEMKRHVLKMNDDNKQE